MEELIGGETEGGTPHGSRTQSKRRRGSDGERSGDDSGTRAAHGRPLGRRLAVAAEDRPLGGDPFLAVIFGFPLYWMVTMSFKPQDEWNPPGKIYLGPPATRRSTNYTDILGHPAADERSSSAPFFVRRLPYDQEQPHRRRPAARCSRCSSGSSRPTGSGASGPAAACCRSRSSSCACSRRSRSSSRCCSCSPYLGLWDTSGGLVIVYGAVTFPFVVWLMRSFFQEVPREIGGGGDRRRLHPVGRVLQGGAAAGEGRPRRDGAVRLHPQLVGLPDRARA